MARVRVLTNPEEAHWAALLKWSHGAVSEDDIKEWLQQGCVEVLAADDGSLYAGATWADPNKLVLFGLHGENMDAWVEELNRALNSEASRLGVSGIQFLSPHIAWSRLLKRFGYSPKLVFYEKEL